MSPISWTILFLFMTSMVMLVSSSMKKFNPETVKSNTMMKMEETKWKW